MKKVGDVLESFVARGRAAQQAVDEVIRAHSPELDGAALADRVRAELEVTNVQISKLFVSRIHRIAARVEDPVLRTELYELADDIEERLSR